MATNWRVGDYILKDNRVYAILQGGLGVVYVVFNEKHRRPYAVKTFRDEALELDPEIPDRFMKEALTWINLGAHPHMTSAVLVENMGLKPLLFLEYVEGGDAGRWVGSDYLKGMQWRLVRLAVQFCDGMNHALARGLKAHRDIKPQNCLITPYGKLKVTDFGLAKAFDDLPAAGARAGTPAYMAPEQFRDPGLADIRADVYSFGVTLHQMLAGNLPFRGTSWADLEEQQRTRPARHYKISAEVRLSRLDFPCFVYKIRPVKTQG